MGVNRIVMHNGVVWWLPPLRPRQDSIGADGPAAESSAPPRREPPVPKGRPRRSPNQGATPPAGFIPLSSLGVPGIDSILDSHADFYRDAYDRAVRDQARRDGRPEAGGEDRPDEGGRAAA